METDQVSTKSPTPSGRRFSGSETSVPKLVPLEYWIEKTFGEKAWYSGWRYCILDRKVIRLPDGDLVGAHIVGEIPIGWQIVRLSPELKALLRENGVLRPYDEWLIGPEKSVSELENDSRFVKVVFERVSSLLKDKEVNVQYRSPSPKDDGSAEA